MIFEVDFEKAYDSLSWEYLDRIMFFLGFPDKWRNWITACMVSWRSSVVLSESPNDEFTLERGLRQGDSFSPFLFIIVTESLHVMMGDVVDNGLFRPSRVGDEGLIISHLFYADDAFFMGEWDNENVMGLIRLIKCFYIWCRGYNWI